ncbi:hypothetical protein BC343_03885 [Mucilaginibacter pedocola]|uniref:Conjugal transfer protein TraG n=1 Tax=Mucilaginibacter pedocola TaxID=1792845 RepID=A0A1S9PN19_9SPHI|nr:hypothetical protein BC343_03885 [Mucilaginibacter pedocola]
MLDRFGVTQDEFDHLVQFYANHETRNQVWLFLSGVILTPITLVGAILGYIRGFNRFLRPANRLPLFHPLSPILRLAMVLGVIAAWGAVILILAIGTPFFSLLKEGSPKFWAYLFVNTTISLIAFASFQIWRWRLFKTQQEAQKYGTARFATSDELMPYHHKQGIFIGGDYNYSKQGHILTVAGSRSGKFTNLIAPNLLGWGNIDGSWVVVDPKGEIAAVTGDYQRKSGQNVVLLNPWDLLHAHVGDAQRFNPMDILDAASQHLVDDCYMLAEMLVPVQNDRNKFFSDSARTIVVGLILFIAVDKEGEERSLKTLWKMLRYPQNEWDRLLAQMENWNGKHSEDASDSEAETNSDYEDPNAENLVYASSEIQKLAKSGENTWGSILSTALQATEFLKSPALQQSLQSGFDPRVLSQKNTTVYVIIPADKLNSHSRWLRLVITSCMRAVIRKPNKRVVFALDEFAALGYLPEIETAIGAYAGFNVTVWPILQSLVQLQNLYNRNWEIFIGSSAVRHFFGIHNNNDAEYVSKAIGKTSHITTVKGRNNEREDFASRRDLMNPDEVRIESGKAIFTFIDDLPPAVLEKKPYYQANELNDRAKNNPYLNI